MGLPVDGDYLVVDPEIEPEPVEVLLGGLESEITLLFDQPRDESGKPQLANETWPDRSRTVMATSASRRCSRAAVGIPPATPPTMTTRLARPSRATLTGRTKISA